MRRTVRELRRAPARIITTVVALALAVAAIGVFAIPTVSTSSLREAARRDGLPEIVAGTTDTGTSPVLDQLAALDNVERVEGQVETTIAYGRGWISTVIGYDLDDQQLDRLRVDDGRLPTGTNEILVTEGMADIGTDLFVTTPTGSRARVEVVGIGGTSYWSGDDLAFTNIETARRFADIEGVNRLVIDAVDDGSDALSATANEARTLLAAEGITYTYFPETLPDGDHPIDADIQQVSMLIGLLGVVAGLVALVLLGSTTNTLITERTREVAVMRALGAPNRQLRRRLRRLAVGIAAAAVVIGVPLGVLVSNFIARMVLEEFVGLTPGFAVSIPVMIGSAVFALVGARLVAARAARRVTKLPLAEALRDRDGNPYGRRAGERVFAKVPTGGLFARTALRNGIHRRARSLATLAQITAAVAALMIITSLATTVNDFNTAEMEPWQHSSETWVAGPGLDIARTAADGDPRSEVSITVEGEVAGWQVDVSAFEDDTVMVDRTLDEGVWPTEPGEALASSGFASRTDIAVGDRVDVELASGTHEYEIVGLHPNRGRILITDVDGLAADLGTPGMANRMLSLDETPAAQSELSGIVGRSLVEDSRTEDQAARDAILMIFGAIGLVVVSVAGLAVASGLAVNVYERRHEFAALQAIGGRRRHVFRVVSSELLPLAVAGIVLGLAAGYVGAGWIMASFEASNAVEIGFTFATGAIPAAVAIVVIGSLVLGGLVVRRVTRRPVAVTLRGAA